MKKIILYTGCILFLGACVSDGNNINEKVNYGQNSDNPYYNLRSTDKIVTPSVGNYLKYDVPAEFAYVIHSQKYDPLTKPSYEWAYFNKPSLSVTRVYKDPANYEVLVNGKSLDDPQLTRSAGEFDLSGLFGTTVGFEIRQVTRNGIGPIDPGIKDPDKPTPVGPKLYIPAEIDFVSPKITSDEERYPLLYYKDLKLKWNADPKNPNGILVMVEWYGKVMVGNDLEDMYYRALGWVEEDNGSVVLTENYFDGLPDTALCYITLVRAAIENCVIEEQTFDTIQIMAETHCTLPFILIKQLK